MPFGEYLIKKGLLTQEQINKVLKVQIDNGNNNKEKKLFGEIAADLGFIDKSTVENEFLKYCKED